MGETTTLPAPPAPRHDEWLDRRWRLTGSVAGALVLLTAALLVTLGVRPASYGDLLSDVASGKVDEVQVLGVDHPRDGDRVQVRWTVWAGVLDQYADVVVGEAPSYDAWREVPDSSSVDPRETLRTIDRGITFTDGHRSSSVQFAGWEVPGWVALLAVGTWVGVLLLLVGGPEPRRATRWAWFWALLLGGPLGVVAFLLLGGPLAVARPRVARRRLTGGWAFLLFTLVFPSVWSTGF